MKIFTACNAFIFCGIGLFCCDLPIWAAPQSANTSLRHAQSLHFARGATLLCVRGFLANSQHRFYTVKIGAGQRLRFNAASASQNPDSYIVPLIAVTPPRGKFNGDKTAIYTSNFTRAGVYKIRVSTNSMASNARAGTFVLRVFAR